MNQEYEGQHGNGYPTNALVLSAFAEKEKKERTTDEDRTSERIGLEVGKARAIFESFEQHFVQVPWNSMKRKKSMLIPRLLKQLRDPSISKIQNRLKAREVIRRG